jgi:hypothetical protein
VLLGDTEAPLGDTPASRVTPRGDKSLTDW